MCTVVSDASALNSGDCFVLALDGGKTSTSLDGKSRVFAWNGRGSSGDERSCAEVIASSVVAPALGLAPSEVEVVDEGSEPDAFWAQIGEFLFTFVWTIGMMTSCFVYRR